MKNLFALSFVVAVVSLSSCKKDHTCVCTNANGATSNYSLGKTSKTTAKANCAAYAITVNQSCSVK